MSDLTPFPPVSHRGLKVFLLIAVAAFALILAHGTYARIQDRDALRKVTEAAAVPTVVVVQPGGQAADRLVLPGRTQAFAQAPVYARTNGYLRSWHFDMGQSVKAGQVLAVIDTPEVDQQLTAARAALATADAEYSLAKSTADRWSRLVTQRAVAQQEADERNGNLASRQANRDEAAANVERLRALSDFKRVVAPFSGTVTSRTTDIGALISSTGAPQPLFTISDVSKLRLFVSIPQAYAARIRDGLAAEFSLPDHPGQTFAGRVDRSSQAVDPMTGAMLVQVIFDNQKAGLKPGAYASVDFKFAPRENAASGLVRLPVSSLLFRREGPSVAIVGDAGKVRLQSIQIRTDFGSELEVHGVAPTDWVVDNPPDDIQADDVVKANPKQEGKKNV